MGWSAPSCAWALSGLGVALRFPFGGSWANPAKA